MSNLIKVIILHAVHEICDKTMAKKAIWLCTHLLVPFPSLDLMTLRLMQFCPLPHAFSGPSGDYVCKEPYPKGWGCGGCDTPSPHRLSAKLGKTVCVGRISKSVGKMRKAPLFFFACHFFLGSKPSYIVRRYLKLYLLVLKADL